MQEKTNVFSAEFKEATEIEIMEEPFTEQENKEAIKNASLNIDAVLGDKVMTIREILNIKSDEIIWLKKTIDEPVVLMSGGRKIANAETTNSNGKLAVKILSF
jgi:flagellar motor switch/type III secretory pathway protein FliN